MSGIVCVLLAVPAAAVAIATTVVCRCSLDPFDDGECVADVTPF
jgi:hypothetical protein